MFSAALVLLALTGGCVADTVDGFDKAEGGASCVGGDHADEFEQRVRATGSFEHQVEVPASWSGGDLHVAMRFSGPNPRGLSASLNLLLGSSWVQVALIEPTTVETVRHIRLSEFQVRNGLSAEGTLTFRHRLVGASDGKETCSSLSTVSGDLCPTATGDVVQEDIGFGCGPADEPHSFSTNGAHIIVDRIELRFPELWREPTEATLDVPVMLCGEGSFVVEVNVGTPGEDDHWHIVGEQSVTDTCAWQRATIPIEADVLSEAYRRRGRIVARVTPSQNCMSACEGLATPRVRQVTLTVR